MTDRIPALAASPNPAEALRAQLVALIDAFSEGRLDPAALKWIKR